MKLIDKYLLREYLVPLLCCLFGFCLLYIVSGLFDKASDFIRSGVTLDEIVCFYALSLIDYADQSNVSFLVTILPVVLLVAALYSLSRLTRQNELTAMCSSGVSIVRLTVPFLWVGLTCSILSLAIQEFVAPRVSRLTAVFLAANGKPTASPVVTSGMYYDGRSGCLWRIGRIDLSAPTTLEGVEVRKEFSHELQKAHPDSIYSTVITNISKAEWKGDRWLFHGGTRQQYDPADGQPLGVARGSASGPMEEPGLKATPMDIAFGIESSGRAQRYVPAWAVLKWVGSREHPSKDEIMQSVDAHRRLAAPWACIIAVMLAIPAGVRGGRDGVITGMILALALFITFYFTLETAIVLGKKQSVLQPWLGAWFANIVFFLVGAVAIRRVRN